MDARDASELAGRAALELKARAVGAIVERFGLGVLKHIGVRVAEGVTIESESLMGPRRILASIQPDSGTVEVWKDPSPETRELVARVRRFVLSSAFPSAEAVAHLDQRHSIKAVVREMEAEGATVLQLGEYFVVFFGEMDPPQVCGEPYLRLQRAVDLVFRQRPLPIGFEEPTQHERQWRRTWAVRTLFVFWLVTDQESEWCGGPFSGDHYMARSSAYWNLLPSRQEEFCEAAKKALEILTTDPQRTPPPETTCADSVEAPNDATAAGLAATTGGEDSAAPGNIRLGPAELRAFSQYSDIERGYSGEKRLTDKLAHRMAIERFGSEDVGPRANWERSLRRARNKLGMQKNNPRAGRECGSAGSVEEIYPDQAREDNAMSD